MRQPRHYFTLLCKGGNSHHASGQRTSWTDATVNIGETADCDVRYDSGDYEPCRYATIRRTDDGTGYQLISRSPYVEVSLQGKGPVDYAAMLADGDIIQFEGQTMTLLFHQHYDSHYNTPGSNRTMLWRWAVVVVLAAVLIAVLGYRHAQPAPIAMADVEMMESSLFMLRVDSVQHRLIANGHEQDLHPTKVLLDNAPTGTAFLTTDSMLVTARHCVEYWIGANLDLTACVADMPADDIVRWAIETETYNQTHTQRGQPKMVMRVFFSLYDFVGQQQYAFCSTDSCVHISRRHDAVYQLADFDSTYYWRSIRPYFSKRDMVLGDVMWIDGMPEAGLVAMPTAQQAEQLHSGTSLMACGYPLMGLGEKRVVFTQGMVSQMAQFGIGFEANINHGFSGGPVLMKAGDEVVVAGVVSRVDSVSSGLYKWAVPVSEIMEQRNSKKQ